MREGPAEAGEESGKDNESKAQGIEGCLTSDHHDDAGGHGEDDEDEFDGGGLEAEKEGEEEDEAEGGGFAHCCFGERGVSH